MLDRIQLPLQILFFGLVLALAFAFIPVMVKLVIGFQVKANAELPVVRSVAALQNKIIWGFWILLALGLAVAIPAAIQDGFFGSTATPAAAADLGPSQGTLTAAPGHESRRHAGRDDAEAPGRRQAECALCRRCRLRLPGRRHRHRLPAMPLLLHLPGEQRSHADRGAFHRHRVAQDVAGRARGGQCGDAGAAEGGGLARRP